MAAITIYSDFGAPAKIKSDTVSPSIVYEVMGPDAMIFVFWMLSFKPAFSLFSFTFFKRWEYQTTLPASWEICMQVKKQQLELDMEQETGSK